MGQREEYCLMATTPNYDWPTPDDTDLVRDGAEAIRNLGDAIDGTVDTVTGDITTRLDVATTKGDLSVYDGTDYVALAVGTDTHVLTADSGEPTGVKWEPVSTGGLELIASGNLTGSVVSLTSLPTTYDYLVLKIFGSIASANTFISTNNRTTNSYLGSQLQGGSVSNILGPPQFERGFGAGNAYTQVEFFNYNDSTNGHHFNLYSGDGGGGNRRTTFTRNNADLQITSIEMRTAGTFSAGTFELYGAN